MMVGRRSTRDSLKQWRAEKAKAAAEAAAAEDVARRAALEQEARRRTAEQRQRRASVQEYQTAKVSCAELRA